MEAHMQPRLARVSEAAENHDNGSCYGLTETSPFMVINEKCEIKAFKIGTVGKIIDKVEVKIAEDGEIYAASNVMMVLQRRSPN
jgi:long-chain acyl-CoA synthetase